MNREIAYNVMKPLVIVESSDHLVKKRKTPLLLNERNGARQIKRKKGFDSFVDPLRGDT